MELGDWSENSFKLNFHAVLAATSHDFHQKSVLSWSRDGSRQLYRVHYRSRASEAVLGENRDILPTGIPSRTGARMSLTGAV